MKFSIAYYLLLIYLSAMFRPAFPLVSDALAHTFCEAVHISGVHMVYGAHHLSNEIATAASDSKKSQTSEKSTEIFAVHLVQSFFQLHFNPTSPVAIFSIFRVNKLPLWCRLQQVPPPNILG